MTSKNRDMLWMRIQLEYNIMLNFQDLFGPTDKSWFSPTSRNNVMTGPTNLDSVWQVATCDDRSDKHWFRPTSRNMWWQVQSDKSWFRPTSRNMSIAANAPTCGGRLPHFGPISLIHKFHKITQNSHKFCF